MIDMPNIYRYILSLILICGLGLVDIQAQEDDFQIWGDVSAKYKINKKIRVSGELGLRSRENSQFLKQSYAEFGVKYKINKRFVLGSKYRYADYYYQSKTPAHRFSFDAAYNVKWKRIRFTVRERYQQTWYISDFKNKYDVKELRSRFMLTYDIKKSKIEPFMSMEHYLGLSGKYYLSTAQNRWTLGLEFPVSKFSSLQIAYRIGKYGYYSIPATIYMFLISYQIIL